MTVFAVVAGLVGRATMVELVIIVGLFAGATSLSVNPDASGSR